MKPTIYIGLGGIGCLTLSHIKKQFENEYGVGKIPTEIAFMAIDFNSRPVHDYPAGLTDDFVQINLENDWRTAYEQGHKRGEYSWMFEQNSHYLGACCSLQTSGRFYFEFYLSEIKHKLNGFKTRQNALWEHEGVSIYIITYLRAGLDAGMLIPLATAIHEEFGSRVNLYGCGVAHEDVDDFLPGFMHRSIAPIMDLDYVMHASPDYPIEMEVGGEMIILTRPIFDGFFVVDDRFHQGEITTINDLCKVISTCLYACGIENDAIFVAVPYFFHPSYNVGYKIGWVQSLGACQVVYKGDLLAKTYGLKAAVELIRKMRQEGTDIHQAALNWTEEVGIREDGNEYNLLTDSIYAPATIQKLKQPNLDVKDTDAAIQDSLNRYFVSLVDFPTEEILKNRTTVLKEALHDKVEKYLFYENGVGNSLEFLGLLKWICEKYRTEMDEEAKRFNKSKEEKQANFDASAFKKYNDEKHGRFTWNRDQRNQELLDEYVARPAKEILKDLHEAKRRESARDIFIALLAEIDILIQSLRVLDQKLAILSYEYETELLNVQREAADALIFEYDLSYNERVNMTMDSNDIVVADFIVSLGKSLTKIDIDTELNEKIKQYAESLPQAQNYRDKIITEVIDNLPDEEYQKLKKEIEIKSARWLSVDSRGQQVNYRRCFVEDAIWESVICISPQPSRLDRDLPFAQEQYLVLKEDFKQEMTFCRIDGSVIPYCIDFINYGAMERYKENIQEAEQGLAGNPHIDRHWFEKMRAEGFSLKPKFEN